MSDVVATKVSLQRPTITVPPWSSFDSFFGPGFSPGAMTLVSSFFTEPDNCSLLPGAMSSPDTNADDFSFFVDNSPSFASSGGGNSEDSFFGPSDLLNSPLQSPFGMSHQQGSADVTAEAALSQSYLQLQADVQQSLEAAPTEASQDQSHSLAGESLLCNSVGMVPELVGTKSPEIFQSNRKTVVASLEKLEYDGYNWRKYGQKQVKASEYPRSYYKCAHVGCPVKKKVERSHEGHVTEITYKCQHNHDPLLSNKDAKDGFRAVQTPNSHVNPRHGSQDHTTSIPYTNTFLAYENGQSSSHPSSQEHRVTSEQDGSQDNSVSTNEDDGNDQLNAKRRCMEEAGASGHSATHYAMTESRIIVQTRSEVDLLDDGYKWRKYGQKAVKGNPYPRSYYRCTYAKCNVRKHVERALADVTNVITTYEGKHNHVIPAARNTGNTRSRNFVPLKSQNMNTEKPNLHTRMDYESKDQISILQLVKEGETAA